MLPLVRDLIVAKIEKALELAKSRRILPLESVPKVTVEHPSNSEHGDFATSLPLRLARATRISPMDIAETLIQLIPPSQEVGRVWAAHPGFINFVLRDEWLQQHTETILEAGNSYGTLEAATPQKVMVEFVSVNPTGPVHVGHTRGAVLGSALAAILNAAGHSVTQEYYVNDAGTQMELFYASVQARYLQAQGELIALPTGGYQGDYVIELAQEILAQQGAKYVHMDKDTAIHEIGNIAREKMVDLIRRDLLGLGIEFDIWFGEGSLYTSGEYDHAIGLLEQAGYLAQREGALWFTSSALGEDRDYVVIRSSGAPTYFASDIAYHHNKFIERGFDRVINIWGADHQGHVARLKAAMEALGIDPDKLEIIISQMVTLRRGNDVIKVSKRSGEFVTLRELVGEVGPDACRYFFLARSPGSQMDFDMELATKESSDNPVYYIQYAHARITSILNNAREQGINWSIGDISLLKHTDELNLIRKMVLLPELVEKVSQTLEPHHLPHYALELATAFHWFYENCRVISSDPNDGDITLARLKLVESAQIVFRRTLELMGMSAPDRM